MSKQSLVSRVWKWLAVAFAVVAATLGSILISKRNRANKTEQLLEQSDKEIDKQTEIQVAAIEETRNKRHQKETKQPTTAAEVDRFIEESKQ